MESKQKMTAAEWKEQQFIPWKQAVNRYLDEKQRGADSLRRHAPQLKHIIALLLEHRGEEAVQLWNDLELQPYLESVEINRKTGSITLKAAGQDVQIFQVGDFLRDLQQMLQS